MTWMNETRSSHDKFKKVSDRLLYCKAAFYHTNITPANREGRRPTIVSPNSSVSTATNNKPVWFPQTWVGIRRRRFTTQQQQRKCQYSNIRRLPVRVRGIHNKWQHDTLESIYEKLTTGERHQINEQNLIQVQSMRSRIANILCHETSALEETGHAGNVRRVPGRTPAPSRRSDS